MKKTFLLVPLAIILVMSLFLVSCEDEPEIKTYTVSFMDGETTAADPQTVEYGKTATAPTAPTKEGHTFNCWRKVGSSSPFDFAKEVITEDTVLEAVWDINTYTVTFDYPDGQKDVEKNVFYGGKVEIPKDPEPADEKYEFLHWTADAQSKEEFKFDTTPIEDNLTLYPVFGIKKFTVTFVGATGISSDLVAQTVEYNSTAKDPNPTVKEGYKIFGWKKEGSTSHFDFGTSITSDITLYADCRDITKVNVSFYDGEKLLSRDVYNCNVSNNFPTFNEVLAGCTIEKWIKADDKTEHTGSFELPYKEDGYRFNAYITTELLTFNNGSVSASNTLKTSLDEISLSIPNTIEGKAVTSIANSAFDHCSMLTSITIPETVTSMGSSVFAYCTGLKSAVIKAKVNTLDANTFNSCDALKSISLSSTITEIKGVMLGNLQNLESITVSENNPYLKAEYGVL